MTEERKVEIIVQSIMAQVGPCLEQLIGKVNYALQGVKATEEGMVQLSKEIDVLRRQNARMKEDIDMLMRDAVCNREKPVNSPWDNINTK